ncbi:hypothetical protein ASPZODRAFT_750604 [Penicilliopsis zonata CBS 506.65]|uniref:Uncharacterized protein n=1 Tax=Penicilliopsis zonata CBS 506.65 TaxID=1073090 RepID=A0A1L9SAL7_9EURO|nr:hypothetical protein ASPZODRAFT_750604 [Penicilliopsis zonata CBS 506.65]OJJ44230.1 hypothetical protein ASPZODRAFT_750604 [Penicilliopsis zonata CBS 506.65]
MASATTSKLWHNGRIKIEATEPLSFGDFFGGNLHPLEGNGDNYSIFDFSGEDEQSPPRENSLENTQNPAATTTITTTTTTTTTATEVNPIGNIPSSPEREEEEGDNESRQSTPIITRARTRANEVAVPQPVPSLNPSGRTSQWKCKTLWGPNRPFPQHLKLLLDSWRANEPKKRPECCFRCFRVTRPSKTFNRNGQLMDLTNYEIWDPLHYQVLVLHDPRTDQSNIVTVAGHGKNCTWLSRWLGPGKGWDSATIAARIFGPRLQDIVYPKGCFAKPSTSILDEKNVGTKSVPKKGQAKQQPQSKRRRLPTSTQTRTEAIQETDSSEESEEEVDSTSESGSSEEDEGE